MHTAARCVGQRDKPNTTTGSNALVPFIDRCRPGAVRTMEEAEQFSTRREPKRRVFLQRRRHQTTELLYLYTGARMRLYKAPTTDLQKPMGAGSSNEPNQLQGCWNENHIYVILLSAHAVLAMAIAYPLGVMRAVPAHKLLLEKGDENYYGAKILAVLTLWPVGHGILN